MGFFEVAEDAVSGTNKNPTGGSGEEKRASAMLEIVKEMRRIRDQLPPRPSLSEITEAEKSISIIEHRLIEKLSEVSQSSRPYGVNPGWFLALQAMREDRHRRDAEIEKKPFLSTVELEQFYRHYDLIIFQAENAILGGGEEPTGLSRNIRVGTDPRLIDYPNGALTKPPSVAESPGGSLSFAKSPAQESPLNTPKNEGGIFREGGSRQNIQPLPVRNGGLSTAFNPGSGIPDLTTIEENQTSDDIPPTLLAMIEDAIVDRRKTFDISDGYGSLTWLPETIGMLDSLTSLNLSQNRLLFIPSSIGNLNNLQKLELHGNQLASLPETIGNLENLTLLDVHGNKIEELPVSIGGCESLVKLNCDFNNLIGLPEALGQCVNLETLSIAINQLKHLPRTIGNLVNLTFLDLHYNQLESLPPGLCNLTNLTTLNIAAQHYNLHELPPGIGNLKSLKEFNMGECYIKLLPDSFIYLTNLKTLKLDGNPLVDPPLDVVKQGKDAIMEHIKNRSGSSGRGSKSLQPREIEFTKGLRKFWHKATGSGNLHPVGSAPAVIGRNKPGSLGSQDSGSFFIPGLFKTQSSGGSDTMSEPRSP